MNAARTMRLTPALVALCQRDVAEGLVDERYDYFTRADYEHAIDRLLSERPPGPFWIFAYGSLIWKPGIEIAERRRCVAQGWHREFSMAIDSYRATPDQHGYMMCIEPGGECEGMLLALRESELRQDLYTLLFREVGGEEHLAAVRWLEVETDRGMQRALTFFASPDRLHSHAPATPLPQVAHALARACGHWGSGTEYLYNTVAHLEELGVHDEPLWRLQELVAHEIEILFGLAQSPPKG